MYLPVLGRTIKDTLCVGAKMNTRTHLTTHTSGSSLETTSSCNSFFTLLKSQESS